MKEKYLICPGVIWNGVNSTRFTGTQLVKAYGLKSGEYIIAKKPLMSTGCDLYDKKLIRIGPREDGDYKIDRSEW